MAENTNNQRKARATRYEDYITRHSEAADAAGHREPYHLTYAKRYGFERQNRKARRL